MNDDELTDLRDHTSTRADVGTPPGRGLREVVGSPSAKVSREVIFALLIGAFVLVAPIAGAVALEWIEVRQTVTDKSAGELSDDVADLQRRLAASEQEAAALREQLAELQGDTAEPASDASQPVPSPDASEPPVLREAGGVQIAHGSCLDLDSQDRDWGLAADDYGFGLLWDMERDLCYGSQGFEMRQMSTVDAEPTLADCESQTLVIGDELPRAAVRDGQWICAYTGDGLRAAVHLSDVADDRLTMRLRVWDAT